MQNKSLLALLGLALTGCHSAPKPASPPLALVASDAPPAATGLRHPEVVRAYTLGAYVDPDDAAIRHDAHTIHRIEAPSRWNLAPVEEQIVSETPSDHSAVISPTDAATVPAPTEKNSLPAVPAILTATNPPVIETPKVVTTTPSEPTTMPNADGVIDLTALAAPTDGDDINPFAVRAHSSDVIREISIRVQGILGGATPGVLVNDRTLLVGDALESLTLERTDEDAAIFRVAGKLLRLPVSPQPIRIRVGL